MSWYNTKFSLLIYKEICSSSLRLPLQPKGHRLESLQFSILEKLIFWFWNIHDKSNLLLFLCPQENMCWVWKYNFFLFNFFLINKPPSASSRWKMLQLWCRVQMDHRSRWCKIRWYKSRQKEKRFSIAVGSEILFFCCKMLVVLLHRY